MPDFLRWFQLAALAVFLGILVERTLYLRLKRKVNPIRLSIAHDGARRVVELGLFLAVGLWAMEVVFYAVAKGFYIFPPPLSWQVLDSAAAGWAGALLIVAGFALFIAALLGLGNSWRLGIDEDTPGELVTGQVYALSRNPIYIFFDLYFLGTFLINGTWIFLVFAVAVAASLHLQILEEERFLLKRYGLDYRNYCARTGRYVTLNWREGKVRSSERGRCPTRSGRAQEGSGTGSGEIRRRRD